MVKTQERIGDTATARIRPHRASRAVRPAERAATEGLPSTRWLSLSGIAFAVLMVIGVLMLTITWDASTDSDAQILSWYADSGNRIRQLIGAVVVAAAGLAFVWFVSELRERLVSKTTRRPTSIMTMSGAVFISALFVGSAAMAAVSADVEIAENPTPQNIDVVRIAESFGYGSILLFGSIAAALCVFATSRAGQITGWFPLWLSRFGYGCAALLLFGIFFFPMVLLPIWALVVSAWSLRTGDGWKERA